MKHAYLIMAHDDFYTLEKEILLLDDKNNDIYIHIDKKVKNFNFNYFKQLTKHSKIYFTKRINVYWSGCSQIKAELILLKTAKNKYSYYHLLSGADLPIKTNKEINSFFNKNSSKEFIDYYDHNNISELYLERIKYYHFFNKNLRCKNKIIRNISSTLHYRLIQLQKRLKINRLQNRKISIRKGANWFSITNDLVNYILENENLIKKTFKYSYCADELFLQTIVYNSKYYKNIYSKENNNCNSIKRHIDWNRGKPYTFKECDYEELVKSTNFYARKFSSTVDKNIIDKIYVKGDINDKSKRNSSSL